MPLPTFDLTFAAPDETAAVAGVLQEAARWIEARRGQLWDPEKVGEAFAAPFVAAGQVLTARPRAGQDRSGEIAAVVILEPEDPHFWPDRPPGEAIYLHKLAVRRAYAGTGAPALLVAHAATVARDRGRALLRLDCDPALAGFYERLGFQRVDERDVVHPEAGPRRVARLERRLTD